ncbi:WYL domain-containing protein, partial [Microbispora rosea]|uniref:WYL domain-containing protein n=1 Tax=Microbispora rosea TaxID=58117 RepID=UPI00341600AA
GSAVDGSAVDGSAVDGSAVDGSAVDGSAVGGGVRMTGRAERLDGMAQVLAGLGVPFTVVGPPELREEVRALARRLEGWAGQASRR